MGKIPFRERLTCQSLGGTYEYLRLHRVKEGFIARVEIVQIENVDSACTDVRAYLQGHGYDHFIFEQKNPSAGTLYWFTDDFYLFPDEQFVIRIHGTTVGDFLQAFVSGYLEPIEPGFIKVGNR